jgi:hypothetical protein
VHLVDGAAEWACDHCAKHFYAERIDRHVMRAGGGRRPPRAVDLSRPARARAGHIRLEDASAWLAAHPQARVVLIHRDETELPAGAHVQCRLPYRGGRVALLMPA